MTYKERVLATGLPRVVEPGVAGGLWVQITCQLDGRPETACAGFSVDPAVDPRPEEACYRAIYELLAKHGVV